LKNGGEDRAYAAGKAGYQTRADTIRANGKASKYAMADGGEPGDAVASGDTAEPGEATAGQPETASA
jgi:hypothetical protein